MTEPQQPRISPRLDILGRHAQAVEEWRTSDGLAALDGDEFESEANRARLATLRAFDSLASFEEELRVRLVSPDLEEGALSFDAGTVILRPLQDSVASLAEDAVELELVGVSAGSTVLHVRARVAGHSEPVDIGGVPVDATTTEAPLKAFIELLRAAESESDLGQWVRAVDALGRFSRALERFDAQADVAWSGVSGEVRTAWFGTRGRSYVQRMLETNVRPTTVPISGRVTELRESGVVKVKTGTTRNAPSYEVRMAPQDLLAMHFEIGQTVHFLVRLEQQIDHLGQTHDVDVFYVSSSTSGFSSLDDEMLPEEGRADET